MHIRRIGEIKQKDLERLEKYHKSWSLLAKTESKTGLELLMDNKLNDNEQRLLQLFRCLSLSEQSDVLLNIGSQVMENCLPDKSIYELMPTAAGVKPEGIEWLDLTNSIAHVI